MRRRCRRGPSSRRRERRDGRARAPSRASRASLGRIPTHIALTRQLSAYASSKTASPPTVGTPTRVSVRADAGDRAVEVMVGRAEAQPVEQRDRPRAHGDDVAQDPADAGRRALERLDGGRVVVRLDLERDRLALAEVEHAGVLARPLQHALARRGQPLQQRRGVLVAAVLGPEQREDRELEVVRLPFEKTPDPLELAVREPERAVQRLFRNLRQGASVSRASDGTVRSVTRSYWFLIGLARRDLGRVLPLHQGRGSRLLAARDDGAPPRVRGASARRASSSRPAVSAKRSRTSAGPVGTASRSASSTARFRSR